MRGLATFIMRGRSQAALVAAAMAVLSLTLPLVGLLSSAAVALVTLRQGVREGLILGLLATLLSGLFVFAALGAPWPALGLALALWAPVWALGAVLRTTRSLALTLHLAALIGLVIVLGLRLGGGDPALYWSEEFLKPIHANLVESGILKDTEDSRTLIDEIARWMTGLFAAIFYVQAVLALFLARWWQALLYHPGGFGKEFRALRLGRGLGMLSLVVLGILAIQQDQPWVLDLLWLILPLLFLQGLAVVHFAALRFALHRGWLVGFYVFLVLAMPHGEVLLAALGLGDLWLDGRAKLANRGGNPD